MLGAGIDMSQSRFGINLAFRTATSKSGNHLIPAFGGYSFRAACSIGPWAALVKLLLVKLLVVAAFWDSKHNNHPIRRRRAIPQQFG